MVVCVNELTVVAEIDVSYGFIFRKYIECKNFTGPVPLDYVAKFKEVLKLNRISPRNGIFITTSYYTPRATTIGTTCSSSSIGTFMHY